MSPDQVSGALMCCLNICVEFVRWRGRKSFLVLGLRCVVKMLKTMDIISFRQSSILYDDKSIGRCECIGSLQT